MCGIIGILGRGPVAEQLVDSLASSGYQVDLAVDGNDLVELGYAPGPRLGEALATLLAEVVDAPDGNRRETLLARAAELLGS